MDDPARAIFIISRRTVCLQYALLGLVAIMSSAALVLLVLGACALSSRLDPSDPIGLVGTLVGGALLLITCSVLLVVVCVWSGRCWSPPPTPDHHPHRHHHAVVFHAEPSPSVHLDPPPTAPLPRERRYLSPVSGLGGLYSAAGGGGVGAVGGGYAPLASHDELAPSLRSSFQSMNDL